MKKSLVAVVIILICSQILSSQDKYWARISPESIPDFNFVKINPKTKELFVSGYGNFYKTSDSGKTWKDVYSSDLPNLPKENVNYFDFDKNGFIYLSLDGTKHFFKSTTKGASYYNICNLQLCNSPQVIGINPKDDHLFVGMKENDLCSYILYSTDGGNSYSYSYKKTSPNSGPGVGKKFAFKGDTIFMADGMLKSNRPTVFRSTDNGKDWTELTNGLPSPYQRASSIINDNSGNIYVGYSDSAGVYKLTNNGETWQAVNDSLYGSYVNDLIASINGDIYAANGYGVFILKKGDYVWNRVVSKYTYNPVFLSIAISKDGNTVYGTDGKSIYMTRDTILPSIEVTAPKENEILNAGSNYSIKWGSKKIDGKIKILFKSDANQNQIVLADSVPFDKDFIWHVPYTPSKASYLILYALKYPNVSCVSNIFTISVKPNVKDSINFRPNPDGYNFANDASNLWPQAWWEANCSQQPYNEELFKILSGFSADNIPCDVYPDWNLYAETFGNDFSLIKGNYNPLSVLRWRGISGNWEGSGYGLTSSSLLYYCLYLQKPNGVTNTFGIPISDESRTIINKYYLYQFGTDFINTVRANLINNPSQTTDSILISMKSDKKNNKALIYYWQSTDNSWNSNSVVPTWISKGYDTIAKNYQSVFNFYDSRIPDDNSQTIIARDSMWFNIKSTTENNRVGLLPDLDISTLSNQLNPRVQVDSNYLEIFFGRDTDVEITNEKSQKLNSKYPFQKDINDATAIIPVNGGKSFVIGYNIPKKENQILKINNTSKIFGNKNLIITTEKFCVDYNFETSQPETKNYILVDLKNDSLSVYSPNTSNIMNMNIVHNKSHVFNILNSSMKFNDTMNYKVSDNGQELIINNFNSQKKYDLFVYSIDNKCDTIRFRNLEFGKNESSIIRVKNWGDLHKDSIVLSLYQGKISTSSHLKDTCLNCLISDIKQNSIKTNDDLSIIPNPVMNVLTLKFQESYNLSQIKIYSIEGIEVYTESVEGYKPFEGYKIDVSNFPQGVYYVKIGDRVQRFVKI